MPARDFLPFKTSGSVAVLVAFALLFTSVLVGCGGQGVRSGSGQGRYVRTQVNSTLNLGGVNRGINPATLSVRTAAGRSSVGADNKVTTLIFAEGPQYAEVLDDQDRTVLMGFASLGEPDFSAHSTAKALAYLALAGAWMKEDARIKLLTEADTVAGFPELLTAIQTQIDTNGFLDLEATDIQSAISAIVFAAYGSGRGVIADPTTASGLSLDTIVDGKLRVENVFLRRVSLFFRRHSHKTAANEEVIESNAFTRIDMPNVARYAGITGTLDSYFSGDVAYSPVDTNPPLEIPRFPADAKSTTYQMFAIGAGGSSHPNLNVPADIIGEQQNLEVKTLFLDGFMVLVANVALPLKGEEIDNFLNFAAANAVITDIIGNLKSNIPGLHEHLANGEYLQALKLIFSSTYTSNTILPAVTQVALDFVWENTSISQDDYDKLFNGMKGVLDKMGKIDIGFTLVDTFLLFRDIASSKRIEQFIITTTPGKVTLVAARTEPLPSETTTIDAIIQDADPNGVYEYNWSVSPNGNYWVEDRTLNGTDDSPNGILVTGEKQVNIRSAVMTDGVAIVHCKAFRLDGGRREVGEDDVTITFKQPETVTNVYDDYQVMTTVFQNAQGKWEGGGGTYIDLPRLELARMYVIGMAYHHTVGNYSLTVLEPLTVVEYFAQSVGTVFTGQVPGGKIRLWVRSWGGNITNTQAQAQADIEGRKAFWIANAKQRPVTVTTRFL